MGTFAACMLGKISTNTKFIVFLSCVVFAVYANTLKNKFVLDDISVITKNTIVTRGISAIPEILTNPYRRGYFIASNDFYRPLSQVMFATEYQLFNSNPMPMHLINVLFFAGCVILLFLFFDSLFGKKNQAFIASLLFALHPIHTEVVANIKGRDDLLCFFFAFLSLNILLRYMRSGKLSLFILAMFSYYLSLLSKETGVTFLLIVPIIFFFYVTENRKRSVIIIVGCSFAAIVFLINRFVVLNAHNSTHSTLVFFMDNALSGAPDMSSRLATAVLILGKYLNLMIIPYPLICDYAYNTIPFVNFSDLRVIFSLLVYLFLIVVGVYRVIKIPKDQLAFGILFYLVTLFLFSNLFFLTGSAMAERFLFFASAGFCLSVAWLIEYVAKKLSGTEVVMPGDKTIFKIMVPVLLVYIAITLNRNAEWKDDKTLYQADIKKAPGNARLHNFLGTALVNVHAQDSPALKGQFLGEAIAHFRRALLIYPRYSDAYTNMGNTYFFLSQVDSAEQSFKMALAINQDNMEALNHLDAIYFMKNEYRESITLLKRAIQIDTNYYRGYNNLGMCYIQLQHMDTAIYYLKKGIVKCDTFSQMYKNLSLAYTLLGNEDSAQRYQAIAQSKHSMLIKQTKRSER